MEEMDTDIVFSSYSTLMLDGTLKDTISCSEEMVDRIYSIDSINWNDSSFKRMCAMHTMATKTTILKNNNYIQTEGISYTDTQFVFYSLLYSNTCSFFDNVIYLYYLGREGQTMSVSSIKKTYFHFYLNADNMLNSYCKINEMLSANKQSALLFCILLDSLFFVDVFLGNYLDVDNIRKINLLLDKAKGSYNSCPIEKLLIKESTKFKLWKQYHIPNIFLYFIIRARRILGMKSWLN
jgi:hypothetical protein